MADNAVLSQREIDALINAEIGNAEAEAAAAAPSARKETGRRVKIYDFRHPEKLSKEQLRGLQIIQQGVAGSLAASFSARLRSPVESRLSALERGIYEEYVAQIGTQAIVVIIDMNPLTGYAVAAFGMDVAFGIIDRLLGGKGKRHNRALDRDLTDIETALPHEVDRAAAVYDALLRAETSYPDMLQRLRIAVARDLAVDPKTFKGIADRAHTAAGVSADLRLDAFSMRAAAFRTRLRRLDP